MHSSVRFDTTRFIHPSQVGGIERYTIDDGPARGVRALCVNTGAGLRYRVLVDRGLDIDHAFHNDRSLTFLTHKGVTPPSRGYDRGLDWLKSFPGGLLTSCGPFNTGGPASDAGEDLGLHGPHSNTAASIESITQPDPRSNRDEISIVGSIRYGSFYNPCVELRRTITSRLGQNTITITDDFFNAGNQDVPHAWLLHINFGYPLIDAGATFCYDAIKVDPIDDAAARNHFRPGNDYKTIPAPLESHRGPSSFVAYLYPKPINGMNQTEVAIVNEQRSLGVIVRYSTEEFPRCANWQHWGPHEYVGALEPANGGVEGRDKDRKNGWLDTLKSGQHKKYTYQLEVVTDPAELARLRKLNG